MKAKAHDPAMEMGSILRAIGQKCSKGKGVSDVYQDWSRESWHWRWQKPLEIRPIFLWRIQSKLMSSSELMTMLSVEKPGVDNRSSHLES